MWATRALPDVNPQRETVEVAEATRASQTPSALGQQDQARPQARQLRLRKAEDAADAAAARLATAVTVVAAAPFLPPPTSLLLPPPPPSPLPLPPPLFLQCLRPRAHTPGRQPALQQVP